MRCQQQRSNFQIECMVYIFEEEYMQSSQKSTVQCIPVTVTSTLSEYTVLYSKVKESGMLKCWTMI